MTEIVLYELRWQKHAKQIILRVPIGAIIVKDEEVIARAHNLRNFARPNSACRAYCNSKGS